MEPVFSLNIIIWICESNSRKTIWIFPVPNSIIIQQYKTSNTTLKLLPFGYLLCYILYILYIILLNASNINMSIVYM